MTCPLKALLESVFKEKFIQASSVMLPFKITLGHGPWVFSAHHVSNSHSHHVQSSTERHATDSDHSAIILDSLRETGAPKRKIFRRHKKTFLPFRFIHTGCFTPQTVFISRFLSCQGPLYHKCHCEYGICLR